MVDARDRSLNGDPAFFFTVPLRPRADEARWPAIVALLGATLRSILGQDDPRFEVIIVGHDRPDLPELDDPRVSFLAADIHRPTSSAEGQPDQVRKRHVAAAEVGRRGGGYIMVVDADDLVDRRIVSFVRSDRHPIGYMVRAGYIYDDGAERMGLFPDGKRVPQLWANCGTCAILHFTPRDLPVMASDKVDIDETQRRRFYQRLKGHRLWESKLMEAGRFVATLPMRGVIYRMNTGQNLSYDARTQARIDELLRPTRDKPVDLTIKRQFFDGAPAEGSAAA